MEKGNKVLVSKIENLESMIQSLLVLELYKLGLPQIEIGKRLKMGTTSVNGLLRGIKIEK